MTLTKVVLSERDMPSHWYNISADLPAAGVELPPVLHPITLQPVGPADLAPLFPMALIMQEVSTERYIEIPDQVQDLYKLWRPTPFIRARRLEMALDTPAHIYFKYEGASPVGSHKPNTAVPQAFYNKEEGTKALTTETGAGQWGSALAMACNFFGLDQATIRLGLDYGITDRIMVGIGRSSYQKTLDGLVKYKLLKQCDAGCSMCAPTHPLR